MLNRLLVSLMPLAPRFIIKMISKQYIAGDDSAAAIATCLKLKSHWFLTTLDILGESIFNESQANASRDEYLQLISEVAHSDIDKNISLKPTALGLGIAEDLALNNITEIIAKAEQAGVFIRIDMEDSPHTTKTIKIHDHLKQKYSNLGTVIQAYMRRSLDDVKALATQGSNLRICKGIYKESVDIAFHDPEEIRANYLSLIEEMLTQGAYVGIATHDPVLIDASLALISKLNISPEKYEFQALLGVPITKRLQELRQAGHRVRIYVPFGSEWYAYSSRRLKENPDMAGYILKNMFVRG